jgi:hypothetical protein
METSMGCCLVLDRDYECNTLGLFNCKVLGLFNQDFDGDLLGLTVRDSEGNRLGLFDGEKQGLFDWTL